MKFLILTIMLLFSNFSLSKEWNCNTIESTLSIVEVNDCKDIRFCVGYATCLNKDQTTTTGRIVCKVNSDFSCPSANDCLKQVSDDHNVQIAYLNENNTDGVYRHCNSETSLMPLRDNDKDVVNSRFCNTISGSYNRAKAETVDTMTTVTGGGGQTGSGRK